MPNSKYYPPNRAILLGNIVCPYCGGDVSASSTKEHVVGRRFVPKGTLENRWNLILNACEQCNSEKAKLEDDVSAITMQPAVDGRYHSNHPQLALDALRKGKGSTSARTGMPVAESGTSGEVTLKWAALEAKFGFVGPPQLDNERAFELARYHFNAFFYFITYDESQQRGWWWPGTWHPIQVAARPDWGNDTALDFMAKTRSWQHRLLAATAEGHFRVCIRKSVAADLWAMALEWNHNHRVLAACGQEGVLLDFVGSLSVPKYHTMQETAGTVLRHRREIPLQDEVDTLFAAPDDPA